MCDPPTRHATHCMWYINFVPSFTVLKHLLLTILPTVWSTHLYPTSMSSLGYLACFVWHSLMSTCCVVSGIQSWATAMLGYLANPVHCVSSCTCPVMSTQCLLNLASPVHSVCSLTWSVLCTLCVYMYPASPVHSVCSISYLVLCTMCVPLVTQSCAFCVFLYLSSVYAMRVCSNIWPVL